METAVICNGDDWYKTNKKIEEEYKNNYEKYEESFNKFSVEDAGNFPFGTVECYKNEMQSWSLQYSYETIIDNMKAEIERFKNRIKRI